MNTEQLVKQFEWRDAYKKTELLNGDNQDLKQEYFRQGYQAAAQSRDELIMELVYVLDSATSYVDRDTLLEAMQRVLNQAEKMGYVKSYEEIV